MKLIYILLLTFLLIGCAKPAEIIDEDSQVLIDNSMQMRDISGIKKSSEDGTRIAATVYSEPSDKGILLIHMLNRDKSTWDSEAKQLRDLGYKVIAMDLRGHGNSDGDWKQAQNMLQDVDSMVEELGTETTIIMGASIGANLALLYAAEHPKIDGIVLLSPGEDYRGLLTFEAAAQVTQPALIVVSKDDDYASRSSQELSNLIQTSEMEIYTGSEHGTDMFTAQPLLERITTWLEVNG